jgi:hypothetical protein
MVRGVPAFILEIGGPPCEAAGKIAAWIEQGEWP